MTVSLSVINDRIAAVHLNIMSAVQISLLSSMIILYSKIVYWFCIELFFWLAIKFISPISSTLNTKETYFDIIHRFDNNVLLHVFRAFPLDENDNSSYLIIKSIHCKRANVAIDIINLVNQTPDKLYPWLLIFTQYMRFEKISKLYL